MASLLLDRKLLTPRAADARGKGDSSETELDVPEPMSGEFLRGVCHELGPRFDIAIDLGISKPEVETIMADPLLTSDEEKMFKVLVVSRDKTEKVEESLRSLLLACQHRKLTTVQNYILHNAQRWMILHGGTDDHFAHAVGDVLDSVTEATP